MIVSDSCGMFALIVFPFSCDSVEVLEAHKYQFNSLKFIEKEQLSQKYALYFLFIQILF